MTQIFRRKAEFRTWVQNARRVNASADLFIRFDYDLCKVVGAIDDERTADRAWTQVPAEPGVEDHAWHTLHEEAICTFFVLRRAETVRVLVGIRNGLWSDIDELHLGFRKAEFVVIEDDEARSLTDRESWRRMMDELSHVGMTVRIVYPGM